MLQSMFVDCFAVHGCGNLEIMLLVCKTFRVSDYAFGFGYPRVSILGMSLHPNWSSGRVRVSVLGAQTLHSNRTGPVAILRPTKQRDQDPN